MQSSTVESSRIVDGVLADRWMSVGLWSGNVGVAADLCAWNVVLRLSSVMNSSLRCQVLLTSELLRRSILRLGSELLGRSAVLLLLSRLLDWTCRNWLWPVAWVHSGVVTEAVLEDVRDWSLVRPVVGWHIGASAGCDHINSKINLTDLLLSIVIDWYPVLEVASANYLSQIKLGSSNEVMLANNIVVKAINKQELFSLDWEMEGVFPLAFLALTLSDLSFLWASTNLDGAVRIHLSHDVVIFVELTHLRLHDQSTGQSVEHWVGRVEHHWRSRHWRTIFTDLGWLLVGFGWSLTSLTLLTWLSWLALLSRLTSLALLAGSQRLARLALLSHWTWSIMLSGRLVIATNSRVRSSGVSGGRRLIYLSRLRHVTSCRDWNALSMLEPVTGGVRLSSVGTDSRLTDCSWIHFDL